MSPNPPFSILKKALFRPYTVLFRPIKSQCFRQFSSVIQSVILASKIIFKISPIPLAGNETFPTFAPAFREGASSLKRAN